jgi:hypothetical protein
MQQQYATTAEGYSTVSLNFEKGSSGITRRE